MDNGVWKSVLLDWVNSTGFLVQNYENLIDTNVQAFFNSLKLQLKSIEIKSDSIDEFVKEYYKDFNLTINDGQMVKTSEYSYIYSVFLHFSCVMYPDDGIQSICKNMVRKNQEMIARFFGFLMRVNKCDRSVFDSAIEEAEAFDLHPASVLENRYMRSIFSDTSPQTPKSKLLNNWSSENRVLKAQLETERYERENIESQLNQSEKRLGKLDEDFKKIVGENVELRKQIQMQADIDALPNNEPVDETVKKLRREIDERDKELFKLTREYGDALDDKQLLNEQLARADNQIKALNRQIYELNTDIEGWQKSLDEQQKQIEYIQNDNRELQELIKELQANSRKSDFNSTASYDLLNTTGLSNSSFIMPEENLANAIVDVRLIDQQKQNAVLNDSVQRLQDELSTIQTDIQSMYSIMREQNTEDVDMSSVNAILSKIKQTYTITTETNAKLCEQIELHSDELRRLRQQEASDKQHLTENQKMIDELQKVINLSDEEAEENKKAHQALLDSQQGILTELATTRASLDECEGKMATAHEALNSMSDELNELKSEIRMTSATHADELRRLQTEWEEKVVALTADLEVGMTENSNIQTKLEEIQAELEKHVNLLEEKNKEISQLYGLKAESEKIIENQKQSLVEHETSKKEMHSRLSMLDMEKQALEQRTNTITTDLETRMAENAGIQRRLERVQEELQTHAKLLQEKNEEIAEFNGLRTESEKRIEHQKQCLAENEAMKKEMGKKLSMVEMDKGAIQQRMESVAAELEARKFENSGIQKKLEEVQAELQTHAQLLEEKNEEIAELNGLRTESEQVNNNQKQSLAENEAMKKEMGEQLAMLEMSKEALEQRVETLTADLEARLATNSEIQTKLEKVQAELQTHLKFLEEKNKEISRLNDINIEFEQTVANQKQSLAEHETSKKEMRNQLAMLEMDKDALQQRMDTIQADLEARITENSDVQTKLVELQAELQTHVKLLEEKNEEISRLNSIKTESEQVNNNQKQSLDEYDTMKKEMQNRLSILEMNKEVLEQRVETLTADLTATLAKNSDIQTKLEEVEVDLATHVNLLEEKNEEVSRLNSINKDSEQMVINNKQSLAENEVIKKEMVDRLSKLEENKEELEQRMETLTADLISKQEELMKLAEEKAELSVKCDEEHKLLAESASKVTALQKTIDLLNEEADENKKAHQTLLNSQQGILTELATTKASLHDCEERMASAHESLNNFTDDMDKLKLEIRMTSATHADELRRLHAEWEEKEADFTADLEVKMTEIAGIQTKLEDVQAELETQTKLLEEKNGEISRLNGIKTASDQMVNNQKQSLAEHEAMKSEMDGRLSKLEENKEVLEQHIETLKADLVSKQDENTKLVEEKSELFVKCDELAAQHKLLSESASRTTQLQETINLLNEEAEENKKANQKLLDHQEVILAELAAKKASLVDYEGEVTSAQESLKSKTAEIDKLNSEIRLSSEAHTDEIKRLHAESDGKVVALTDDLNVKMAENSSMQTKLEEVQAALKTHEKLLEEKHEEIARLNSTKTETEQMINSQKQSLAEHETTKKEMNNRLSMLEMDKHAFQQRIEALTADLMSKQEEYRKLALEKSELSVKCDELAAQHKLFVESASKKSELHALTTKITQLEAKYKAEVNKLNEEGKAIAQDRGILHAKLKKERETAEQKEKEHKETRREYEEKLEKMKEKMKSLYKDEMNKLREKHEQQLFEEGNEKQHLTESNNLLEKRVADYAAQMHKLNEDKLQLFKQQEIMKTRLRKYEIDSTLNNNQGHGSMLPPKMRTAPTFKMEDEEGELFDNTYLDHLIGDNRLPPTGRESLSLDEIQRRNSMCPPHLRSSYVPQYATDGKAKNNENANGLNDSMASTQSATRRATAYKRPGPPTPSKNGGRFSLGSTFDLPRDVYERDVLRESNANKPTEKQSIGGAKSMAKKSTPGKLRNLFTSSKVKDEATPTGIQMSALNLPKHIFCTSTPRRRMSKTLKLESSILNQSMPDLSVVDQLYTPNLAKKLLSRTRRISKKQIYWSAQNGVSSDSTSDYGSAHGKPTFVLGPRKSLKRKKRKSSPPPGISRYNRHRRELRFQAFNKHRHFSKLVLSGDETYSIGDSVASNQSLTESVVEDLEIQNFQAVVNNCKGMVEIDENHNGNTSNLNDFEQLCQQKRSEYTDNCVVLTNDSQSGQLSKSNDINSQSTLTAYSAHSTGSMDSEVLRARQSSHCARVCWNQHKLPELVNYPAQKPGLAKISHDPNKNSPLFTSIATLRTRLSNVFDTWNNIPPYLQYYLICSTVSLLAMLYMQL